MNFKLQHVAFCLFLITHTSFAVDKWSRQLEATGPGSETYDWIPVAQPVDGKDRAGRVITYQQNFPPNSPFGEFQKHNHVPSSQQVQPFGIPFHFQRFQQPQAQPLSSQPHISQPQLHPIQQQQQQLQQQQPIQQQKLNLHPQQPTSQSFFKFEMPFNRNQENSQGVQTGYQIQHSSFGAQQPLFQTPLLAQKQFFPPEFHPLQRPQQSPQPQQSKPVQQNFIEEPVKTFRDPNPIPTQENLASTVSPAPSFPIQQAFDLQKPASFQSQLPFHTSAVAAPAPSPNLQQDKEVQLLYVPYDTLYNQQRNENPTFENSQYNVAPHQQVNPYQINNFYMPDAFQPHVPNKFTTSTTAKPATTTFKPSTPYQNFLNSQYTTPKPKPKAHQPPLAMFLFKSTNYPTKIDVVNELKNAKTIAVLDAPTQQAPSVFVGPAGMQTPSGYAKFELPYLSQLAQSSNIADVHFFVAPLSYRTPAGFNKILLPEPHVGSIVVNKQKYAYNDLKSTNQPQLVTIPQADLYNQANYAQHVQSNSQKDNYSNVRDSNPSSTLPPIRNNFNGIREFNQPPQNQHIFITPNQNEVQEISSTTPAPRLETTPRMKSTTPKEYFPEIVREVPKLNRNRFPYEITTQRQPISPYRGNKYSEISTNKNIHSEPIQEVTSPKVYKQERLKPTYQVKRPESQYAQFRPIPNNIPAEDFYKVQPIRTSPPTTSTTTTTTTSSTTPRPHFTQTYPTSPQISFQSTRGQVYHSNDEDTRSTTQQSSSSGGDRFTTHPLIPQQSQSSEEEYRMKQYFRQQDAFRNRPSFQSSTPKPAVENIPYTPVSVDYDREVRIPSSTPTYATTTTTPRPTTLRQRVTFYHPTPTTAIYEENSNTVPAKEQVFEFSRDSDIQTTGAPVQEVVIGQPEKTTIPVNHSPIHSKLKINQNVVPATEATDVEYEPNPYQLPSELPPLTPNLPGLVNGLIEQNKLVLGDTETTIQMDSTTTPAAPETRPTRRLINRIKKPVVSKVSQSVSYSSSDYSTRRPVNRTRRPYTARNYTTTSTSTTTRPASSRTPIIRNPNRIRYNPTPEERQSLRIKSKKHGGKKDDSSDDLEYQRDVLKQNYPVFRPSTKRTTTVQPPTEAAEKLPQEQHQIYTVTPASEQNFDGLIEPMQIAQQYQEYPQNNYGPGYFPNEEEIVPTEAALRNEISPVYAASSTTEEPQPTTRRSPFIRRGPRIKTTTETPTTSISPTSEASEERFPIRTRAPPRRVVKVRARTRRPHPASSTSTTTEDIGEVEPEKNNYNKLNRFNQELYQDEIAQRRQRIKSQFHLEPQESQWSPSLSGKSTNTFHPLRPNDYETVTKNYDNEPEIVTASTDVEQSDSYVFNVSAGFGPNANTHFSSKKANTTMSASKKSEKSFADLLEEVMSDIGKESDMKTPESAFFESQKMDSHPNRQGKWKNSNAGESFETAESQNIGAQFFNSLYTGTIEKTTESMLKFEDMYATTPVTEEVIVTSTAPPPTTATESTVDNMQKIQTPESTTTNSFPTEEASTDSMENLSTAYQPESITRRIDDLWNVEDLDSQPSMFSEVRKQLNELFKSTDDDNDNDNDNDTVEFVQPHRHEYKNIQRVRTVPEVAENQDDSSAKEGSKEEKANMFHENLMESVVYATSTSSKDDMSETEICYRGHCIRSEDLPPNHKLH